MALITRLPAVDAALAAARSLERLLGHDVMLTVGDPVVADLAMTPLPEGMTRAIALPFGADIVGEVTLVTTEQFATSMEAATADASLIAGALPALAAAAEVMQAAVPLHAAPAHAGEIATETLVGASGEFVTAPVFENDTYVAAVVVRVIDDGHYDQAVAVDSHTDAYVVPPTAAIVAASDAGAGPAGTAGAAGAPPHGVAAYQFQTLGDGNGSGGPVRPLALLNDVQMQIVAELGHQRMKVRDLVALEPGSVIQLDRAAGSPVDVLVNGALIAHGEVVVIDEEFGIRVSEIVVGDN